MLSGPREAVRAGAIRPARTAAISGQSADISDLTMKPDALVIYPDGTAILAPWPEIPEALAKQRARKKLNIEIEYGRIVRPTRCERCKRKSQQPIEAHHEDYSRPLDVEWLCFTCHRAV